MVTYVWEILAMIPRYIQVGRDLTPTVVVVVVVAAVVVAVAVALAVVVR